MTRPIALTATRTQKLEVGPFPRLTPLQQVFIAEAERHGWAPIVLRVDGGVSVTALKVEPVRTVRQRVARPAADDPASTEAAPAAATT